MFSLLIESLSKHHQAELLSLSLDRQGKGLTCSPFFLELPIDEILYALLKKLSEYKKSYCTERLKFFGIDTEKDIEVDRIAEFLIFCRQNLVDNKDAFDSILSQRYSIPLDQLKQQKGGLRYGYWLLAYHCQDSLKIVSEFVKPHLKQSGANEAQPLDFEEELAAYCERKTNKYSKATPCYFSGEVANPINASTSPYKVNLYSNHKKLGYSHITQSFSPKIQKELALRRQCFGDDLEQERVWIYGVNPMKNDLNIQSAKPLTALYQFMPMVAKGENKLLVSTSIIPYDIEDDYLVENFPHWLYLWGCEPRGNKDDAQRIVDVLHAFAIVHRYNPLSGGWNVSMNKHGNNSNGDISYVLHQLRDADFHLVRSIELVKISIA